MSDIAQKRAKIARPRHGEPEYITAAAVEFAPGWSMAAHGHDHHELLIFETGGHEVALHDGVYASPAGGTLLFAPGTVHAEAVRRRARWTVVVFRWPNAPDLPVRGDDPRGRMRVLARWLVEERDSLSSERNRLCGQFLRALLGECVDVRHTRGDVMVERVRRAVAEDWERPWRLDELARIGGYSRYAFVREYARRAGRTPMADIRRMRLERARELLLLSDLPPKAVAARTGLGDGHSLSRLFVRYFGHTPGDLRHNATLKSRGSGK